MFNSFSTPKPDAGLNNIKSIQRGMVDMNNLASTNITISAVDLSKSIVTISVEGTNTTDNTMFNVELTTPTNILINRVSLTNVSQIIRYTVITFNNVKSKQSGTATATTTGSVNVTVSPVVMNKSICFVSGTSTDTSSIYAYTMFAYDLSSETVLTISRRNIGGYTGTFTHKWQLLEFN